MSETGDPSPDHVANLLKEDRERRMQNQETRRQVKARHVGIEAFRKGSIVPDALFEQKSTQRRTWTIKMMDEMAKHPGIWFEKYYVYDSAKDAGNGPSSTALMFNRAHEGRTSKNKPYADFIEKRGGRFFAEYTTNPIEPTSPANPYPGKWVHVIRVKWVVEEES